MLVPDRTKGLVRALFGGECLPRARFQGMGMFGRACHEPLLYSLTSTTRTKLHRCTTDLDEGLARITYGASSTCPVLCAKGEAY